MTRLGRHWLALGLSLTLPISGAAETAYVIDRLLVGVHEDKSLNSAIIKVLPTGTSLEILTRDGDFAQVRTTDGSIGWIDANYVMSEKPAQLVVVELEAEHKKILDRLEEAQARLRELTANAGKTASPAERADQTISSDALRELQRLTEENELLRQQVAKAKTVPEPEAQPNPPVARKSILRESPVIMTGWQWGLLGSILLLAFSVGGYLVDRTVRRRHYLVDRGESAPRV